MDGVAISDFSLQLFMQVFCDRPKPQSFKQNDKARNRYFRKGLCSLAPREGVFHLLRRASSAGRGYVGRCIPKKAAEILLFDIFSE